MENKERPIFAHSPAEASGHFVIEAYGISRQALLGKRKLEESDLNPYSETYVQAKELESMSVDGKIVELIGTPLIFTSLLIAEVQMGLSEAQERFVLNTIISTDLLRLQTEIDYFKMSKKKLYNIPSLRGDFKAWRLKEYISEKTGQLSALQKFQEELNQTITPSTRIEG